MGLFFWCFSNVVGVSHQLDKENLESRSDSQDAFENNVDLLLTSQVMPQETSGINLEELKVKKQSVQTCQHRNSLSPPPPSLLHVHTHTFACHFYVDHSTEMSQPADKSGNLRVIMNLFAFLSSLHMWQNSKRTQPVQLQISCSFTAGWSPSPDRIIIIPIILITLSPANSKPFKRWWFIQLHIPHLNFISKYEHTWW